MASDWVVSPAGDWHGLYGSRGVWVAGIPDAGYPAGVPRVPLVLSGGATYVTAANSVKPFALAKPDGSGRIEAMYYNGSHASRIIHARLDIPAEPALVRFYCYDRNNTGAHMRATVRTLGGVTIDEGFTLSSFAAGVYAGLQVPGPCIVTWEGVTGYAQISGIFIDPPDGPPPDNVSPALVAGRVDETGTQFVATFSEPVQGETGLILSGQAWDGGVSEEPVVIIPTVLESREATQLTFRIARSRPVFRGERIALTYQTGDIQDLAGNPLAPFSGTTVTNDSQVPGPDWQDVYRVITQPTSGGYRKVESFQKLGWPEV